MRRLCPDCAADSERWVTVHGVAWGDCTDCGQHSRLQAVRATAPNAAVTAVPNREQEGEPWRCPCCAGAGQVPRGLMQRVNGIWFLTKTACQECGGRGVIWAAVTAVGERHGS